MRRNLHLVHSLNIGFRETNINASAFTAVLIVEVANLSTFSNVLNKLLHLLNAYLLDLSLLLLLIFLLNPLPIHFLLKFLPFNLLNALLWLGVIVTDPVLVSNSLLSRLVIQLLLAYNLHWYNIIIKQNNFSSFIILLKLASNLLSIRICNFIIHLNFQFASVICLNIANFMLLFGVLRCCLRFRTVATILFRVTDSLGRLILQLLLFWRSLFLQIRRIIRLLFPPLFLEFLLWNLVLLRHFWWQSLSLHSCHETRTKF